MKSRTVVTFVALLVSGVLVAGTLGGAVATDPTATGESPEENASPAESEVVEIGRQDIEIRDLLVTISDTHIEGTGLPSESVDEARYTVDDSTIETDGFFVTYQGTTYQFCPITITIDDVGLELQDVSIGDGSSDGQSG